MTTISTTSRRLAAGFFAAAVVAGLAAATPAAGVTAPAPDGACSFDPAYLPKTADAADGWYVQCRSQQDLATTTASLPKTADSIDAWSE